MSRSTLNKIIILGVLPAPIVYVNGGNELAEIDSQAGILSPSLIASFVVLGLFQITVKKLVERYRKSRVSS